ncbi:MAG: class I SAM-dependent methyltransferase, partial [Leptolyngbyaceae cyanobacterium bins.59]|nr:class I SAM-dependent methyltransferase [Leptolyngbyaceae cyanobacterium bins.59]
MARYTIEFLKYLVGLRDATTHDTPAELNLLATLAKGRTCIVEVGVYEGAASRVLSANMDPQGKLYLVDPYFQELTIEKLFKFSIPEYIAKRAVKPWEAQVEFIRTTSVEAAQKLAVKKQIDLVFIDAAHHYEAVLEDFKIWSEMLSPTGVIAFHDS